MTARLANQISPSVCSLTLLLIAIVWRRGGSGSLRLLASDKQKVTSLKNGIISSLGWLCSNNNNTNYVGFIRGACLVAFKEGPLWFDTFCGGIAGSLAFRSLKWRRWSNRCVIMSLPTRVCEKKSQVIISGEAVRSPPAAGVCPGLWWKLHHGWVGNIEAVYVFAAKVPSVGAIPATAAFVLFQLRWWAKKSRAFLSLRDLRNTDVVQTVSKNWTSVHLERQCWR